MPRGPARRLDDKIVLRVPRDLRELLVVLAAQQDRLVSGVVRNALRRLVADAWAIPGRRRMPEIKFYPIFTPQRQGQGAQRQISPQAQALVEALQPSGSTNPVYSGNANESWRSAERLSDRVGVTAMATHWSEVSGSEQFIARAFPQISGP